MVISLIVLKLFADSSFVQYYQWLLPKMAMTFGLFAVICLVFAVVPIRLLHATRDGLTVNRVTYPWAEITAIEIRRAPSSDDHTRTRLVIATTVEDAAFLAKNDALLSVRKTYGGELHYFPGIDDKSAPIPLDELRETLLALWHAHR